MIGIAAHADDRVAAVRVAPGFDHDAAADAAIAARRARFAHGAGRGLRDGLRERVERHAAAPGDASGAGCGASSTPSVASSVRSSSTVSPSRLTLKTLVQPSSGGSAQPLENATFKPCSGHASAVSRLDHALDELARAQALFDSAVRMRSRKRN